MILWELFLGFLRVGWQVDLRTVIVIVLLLGLMYIPRGVMRERISPILFIAICGAIGTLFWGI